MKPKLPNMISTIMNHIRKPSMSEYKRLYIIGRISLPCENNAASASHYVRSFVEYPVEDVIRLNVNETVQEKIV